jgi:hypothetical protein
MRREGERDAADSPLVRRSTHPPPFKKKNAGVDSAMNTHLKKVKLVAKGRPVQSLDQLSVSSFCVGRGGVCVNEGRLPPA